MYKVSDITKLLGVDRSFLHYYDSIGIVKPLKDDNLYRHYSENDLIALASSKYYRAMGMNLDSLDLIINQSGFEEKMNEMQNIQNKLLYQIEYLKDVYEVSQYAKSLYKIAYGKNKFVKANSSAFEFVPVIKENKIDEELLKDKIMINLLQQFPFVAYAYYFREHSLTDRSRFSCELGLSTVSEIIKKRGVDVPNCAYKIVGRECVNYIIDKDLKNANFEYNDFEELRKFAENNGIKLSGEAVAYCVFTNYNYEDGKIKFLIQAFVK